MKIIKIKTWIIRLLRDNKSNTKRKIYSNADLYKMKNHLKNDIALWLKQRDKYNSISVKGRGNKN